MICFGNVPAGSVLPVFFSTYGKTNGESITLSGLAVTDIEIYKGTSMTQRASDAGYTLLDTDGIDIDTTTGIHAFSIDTGDNTDAGFYAAGSFYTVVVSAVTVDSQTVNFIAATFRIVEAETTAGRLETRVASIANDAITAASIAANAITSSEIADDAITAAKIATGAIDADAIAANAITAAKIADGAIDAATFAAGAIDATAIADNAIDAGAIAADAITAAKVASDVGAEFADALLNRDMSTGTDSGSATVRTVRQALRFNRNKVSISGTTMTVTKEDDTTASWTAEVTTSASADPITAIDPASS